MAIECDHVGVDLKRELVSRLNLIGIVVENCGCYNGEPVDYPLIAKEIAEKVLTNIFDFRVLICGTGLGMSISVNRIQGIRATVCSDAFSAIMAIAHNKGNIIALGTKYLGVELAWEILQAYINVKFLAGVHERRVKQIDSMIEACKL